MAKNYSNILKDIDTIVLAANAVNGAAGNVDATGPGVFPMKYVGFLSEPNQMKITAKARLIREGMGSNLQKGYDFKGASDAFEILNGEAAVVEKYLNTNCDIYLFGRDQVHRIKSVFPEVQIVGDFGVKDKQTVQLMCNDFPTSYADNLELNGVNTTYLAMIPQKYKTLMESIYRPNINFEIYPYLGNFNQAASLYDASTSRVVGQLFNTPTWGNAPIGAPYKMLTFDGISMYGDFGNISPLALQTLNDGLIEFWVNILSADGTNCYLFDKKANVGASTPGFSVYRPSTNNMTLILSDGTNQAVLQTGALTWQGVWKHIAFQIQRTSGNSVVYVNGVSQGTASLTSVASIVSSDHLKVGISNGTFGNFSLAALRISDFGVNGIPANAAAIVAQNFAVERAILGV